MTEKKAYGLAEVAAMTGIPERVLADRCRAGRAPHRKDGRRTVMTMSDIDAYLESIAVKPTSAPISADPEVARIEEHRQRIAARLRRGKAA